MRITVVGPLGPGRLADSLAYGFSELGHEVAPISDAALMPPSRLGRLLARRMPALVRWSRNDVQMGMANAIISTKPRLVVTVKSPYLRPPAIERIRRQTGSLIFNWYPDNPFVDYASRPPHATLRHYDRVIVFSPQLEERVKREVGVDTQYVPFGFDPRYYFPAAEPRLITTDVAFVGQCRPERAELVSTLLRAGFSVRVAGPDWDREPEPVRSAWKPGMAWGADAARLYHEARVGLNDLHPQSNAHSHNMRSWEIPATATPMATTDSAHQRELLKDIPGVGYYAGPADLPATVERLIADAADDELPIDLSAHTYEARCRTMLAAT